MTAIAIGHRAKLVGIVLLAVLVIALMSLVSGTGIGSKRLPPLPQPAVPAAAISAISSSDSQAVVKQPVTPEIASSSNASAAPVRRKARDTVAARAKPHSERSAFRKAFAPSADHSDTANLATSDTATADLTATAAEPPVATPTALPPAVALASVAIQHDAAQRSVVERDDAVQPSVTATPIEQVSEAPSLSDEQLSHVGAASGDVAGPIENGLPGV